MRKVILTIVTVHAIVADEIVTEEALKVAVLVLEARGAMTKHFTVVETGYVRDARCLSDEIVAEALMITCFRLSKYLFDRRA